MQTTAARETLDQTTTQWLLDAKDPSVRCYTLKDVMGEPEGSDRIEEERKRISRSDRVKTLFSGQQADGGFGGHPYKKWAGAHWRLISLVELGIAPGSRPALKATRPVLEWLFSDAHLQNVPKINGLYRRCASQEGNALAVCSRLGLADNPKIRQLAESLALWQWPDGGWNCDRKEEAHHSSFNESLSTMWGLTEYYKATGDRNTKRVIDRAGEFFLKHRIFRSCRTNTVRAPETFHGQMFRAIHSITVLHYPLYWHYDILQALVMLQRAGKLGDPRTKDALDLLELKRRPDGLWKAEDYYWTMRRTVRTKTPASNVEVVDWGRKGPNEMITLNAARVLKAAGRFAPN